MRIDFSRETEVQAAVVHVYETFNVEVKRFSEGRKSRITPGWPDLACFCPQKAVMWLHETKTAAGVQSVAQGHLQQLAESCNVTYVLGGVHEAQEHLRKIGLIATP